jgi:glycosyltransferase involved in cell wall biosynthesis
MQPSVSVVVATHNRPDRLERTISALRAQTFPRDSYELIVVDDGSGPETIQLVERLRALDGNPPLVVERLDPGLGPGGARNRGWRTARGELIAFTDDDCEPEPGWLEALVSVAERNPGAIVQGPTLPHPDEEELLVGFSRTLSVSRLGPWFETANILYPRSLLERHGGFDEISFSRPGGEDTDLAWRAIEQGAPTAWADGAVVHHAVLGVGWRALLRKAARWDETMLCFKRYPILRRELHWRLFWTREHVSFYFALLGLALTPVAPRWIRALLLLPYIRRLYAGRRTLTWAPFRVALDVVESAACIRGSLRYRVLVL